MHASFSIRSAGQNFPKLISALAFQGIVYIYGALSEGITPLPLLEMIAKMPTIKAHNIWLTSGDPEKLKTAVSFIRRGFDEGKLKPVIDRVFPFDEIVEAHRYLETNASSGRSSLLFEGCLGAKALRITRLRHFDNLLSSREG